MGILIGTLGVVVYVGAELILGALFGLLFRALGRLVPARTTDLGVICWWLLSVVAGCCALGWWQEDPTPARLVITVLACVLLVGSGLAMTAAHTALAAERRAPPPSRIAVSPARPRRRW